MRDDENSYLSLEPREESALEGLLGHSITYRIAIGAQAGRKACTLQTVPASPTLERGNPWLAKAAGFSLHAGVAAGTDQRDKVERLCRYIARPAIASGRLVLTGPGDIRYPLKTPYRAGTTHVIFQPLDCIARRAALVPKPRVHLTRYHGVFAPHRRWRTAVTAAQRGSCGS